MGTIQDRLREFIDSKGFHADTDFDYKCGFPRGTVCRLLSRGKTISSDHLAQIARTYPDMDIYYFLTGEYNRDVIDGLGQMVLPFQKGDMEWYREQLEIKDRTIDRLLSLLESKGEPNISQSIQR